MKLPSPNERGYYRMLWPGRERLVAPETLQLWAADDLQDENPEAEYRVPPLEEALMILMETGSVTLAMEA